MLDTTREIHELHNRVTEVVLGRGDMEGLETALRLGIRAAKADPRRLAQLRLLLGQAFFWTGQQAKARAQYRRVLETDPGSIGTMIHLGHTFLATSRYRRAEGCFAAAHETAAARHDHTGQLAALDMLAINADLRNDSEALSSRLEAMCDVIASDPRLSYVHASIAEHLIANRKGILALPMLERLIEHLLRSSYSRVFQLFAVRPFVGVLRQQGRSYEEISVELRKLRSMAPDDGVASDFDLACKWAFEHSRHVYEMILRDQQDIGAECYRNGLKPGERASGVNTPDDQGFWFFG